MSLYKQLSILMAMLFVLVLLATFWINFVSTQDFLTNQMEIQTEDSATSLGFSLQNDLGFGNVSGVETTVNAFFDRGFYSRIVVEDADGVELVSREENIVIEGVPGWFVNLFNFSVPQTQRELSAGWALGGRVTVTGHPGYAYQQLWQVLISSLQSYALGTLTILLLGYAALNILLKPLQAIVAKAEALISRNYGSPLALPRTLELRTVVSAINKMTNNIETTFIEQSKTAERLRKLAYQDALTELGNRRYFEAQMKSVLEQSNTQQNPMLFLIQAHDFKQYNERHGYKKGDMALTAIANVIRDVFFDQPTAVLSRLSGGDFAVFVEDISVGDVDARAEALSIRFANLFHLDAYDTRSVANMGIVPVKPHESLGANLHRADTALLQAKGGEPNAWVRLDVDDASVQSTFSGRTEWQESVRRGIENDSLSLAVQNVFSAHEPHTVRYKEYFVRISLDDGRVVNARDFMLTAEQLKLAHTVDELVTHKVVDELQQSRALHPVPMAINVSLDTLTSFNELQWLIDSSDSRASKPAPRLIFEVPEAIVANNLDAMQQFAKAVRAKGHDIALDNFGRGFSHFGYLKSLHPVYVKIDRAYTLQAADNEDTQFFISNICAICQLLDIDVVATGIETEAQLQILRTLNIDAVQGFYMNAWNPS